jgi:hypothetical protein
MTQEDLKAFVSLAGFILDVAEVQLASLKLFSTELEIIESLIGLRAQLNQMGDNEQTVEARTRLEVLERDAAARLAPYRRLLNDAVARSESNHEKIEAVLATLKAGLRDEK